MVDSNNITIDDFGVIIKEMTGNCSGYVEVKNMNGLVFIIEKKNILDFDYKKYQEAKLRTIQ